MSTQALQTTLKALLEQYGEFGVKTALKKAIQERRGVEKRKPIPRKWVEEAFFEQHGICSICNLPMDLRSDRISGDHKLALAQGGRHNRKNVSAAHLSCNRKKSGNDFVRQSKREQTGDMKA